MVGTLTNGRDIKIHDGKPSLRHHSNKTIRQTKQRLTQKAPFRDWIPPPEGIRGWFRGY